MAKIIFKDSLKNTQIRNFWSQIWAFLFFRKSLELDKFEGTVSKYDNTFLKFYQKKYSDKAYLVEILCSFLFLQNLGI